MNRVAVVTGAAIGIGKAIACRLSEVGYHVIAVDQNENGLKSLCQDLVSMDLSCEIAIGDITDNSTLVNASQRCFSRNPSHWVLVNNASNRRKSGLLSESIDSWSTQLDLMLSAPFHWAREFIANSIPRKNSGSICNISSVAARLATGESPAYHAAKGGLEALTRYLAVHGGLLGANVNVNAVSPGLVLKEGTRSDQSQESQLLWEKFAHVYQPGSEITRESQIAKLVCFVVDESNKAMNGTIIPVDGGATFQDQFFVAARVRNLLDDLSES
jgi:3-oxoacyl-[acyl-carrier protein] reductase